jgi:hypothetical protein
MSIQKPRTAHKARANTQQDADQWIPRTAVGLIGPSDTMAVTLRQANTPDELPHAGSAIIAPSMGHQMWVLLGDHESRGNRSAAEGI